MSQILDGLRAAIALDDQKIIEIRKELAIRIRARDVSAEDHNRQLQQEQQEKWKEDGRAPCVECRHLVPTGNLSYVLVKKGYSPDSYSGAEPSPAPEIRRVCSTCRQKILEPHTHAGYALRIALEKRDDGFYSSSQQGVWRPIAYLKLGEVKVDDHVDVGHVYQQDYTPIGQFIPPIRS